MPQGWKPPTAPISGSSWKPPTSPVATRPTRSSTPKFESLNLNKREEIKTDLSDWDRPAYDPNRLDLKDWGISSPEDEYQEKKRGEAEVKKLQPKPPEKPQAPKPYEFEYAKKEPDKYGLPGRADLHSPFVNVFDTRFTAESRVRDFPFQAIESFFHSNEGYRDPEAPGGIRKINPSKPSSESLLPESKWQPESTAGKVANWTYQNFVRPSFSEEGLVGAAGPKSMIKALKPGKDIGKAVFPFNDRIPDIMDMEAQLAKSKYPNVSRMGPQLGLPPAKFHGGPGGMSPDIPGTPLYPADTKKTFGVNLNPQAPRKFTPPKLDVLDAGYQVEPQVPSPDVPPSEFTPTPGFYPDADTARLRELTRKGTDGTLTADELVEARALNTKVREKQYSPENYAREAAERTPEPGPVNMPPEFAPIDAPVADRRMNQTGPLDGIGERRAAELQQKFGGRQTEPPKLDLTQPERPGDPMVIEPPESEVMRQSFEPPKTAEAPVTPEAEAISEIYKPSLIGEVGPVEETIASQGDVLVPKTGEVVKTTRKPRPRADMLMREGPEAVLEAPRETPTVTPEKPLPTVEMPSVSEADRLDSKFRQAMLKKETEGLAAARIKAIRAEARGGRTAEEVIAGIEKLPELTEPISGPAAAPELPSANKMWSQRQPDLDEALGRVLDRMGTKDETLDQAIEAVGSEYGGKDFYSRLKAHAQGKSPRQSLMSETGAIGKGIKENRVGLELGKPGRPQSPVDLQKKYPIKEMPKDDPTAHTPMSEGLEEKLKSPYAGEDKSKLLEENVRLRRLLGERDTQIALQKMAEGKGPGVSKTVEAPVTEDILRSKNINPQPTEPFIRPKTGEPLPKKVQERGPRPKLVKGPGLEPKKVDVTGIKLTEETSDIITSGTLPEGRAGDTGKMLLRNVNNTLDKIYKGRIPKGASTIRNLIENNPEFNGEEIAENIVKTLREKSKSFLKDFTQDNVSGQRANLEKTAKYIDDMADSFERAAKEDLPQALDDLRTVTQQSVGGILKQPKNWIDIRELHGGFGGPVDWKGIGKSLENGPLGPMMDAIKSSIDKHGPVSTLGNTMKSGMSTFDVSAPLRQGAALMHKGGIKQNIWAKNVKEMMGMFADEKNYERAMKEIRQKPTTKYAIDAGLELTGISAGKEERFLNTEILEKIPGYGRVVKASDRAYTGFLNKLRSDSFDSLIKDAVKAGHKGKTDLFGNTVLADEDFAKRIASFVNDATGRGKLGVGKHAEVGEKAAELLNGFFYSPRLMSSRVRMIGRVINPFGYTKQDAFLRKEALKSALSMAGFNLATNGITAAVGGTVTYNILSADFMKNKFGNTRVEFGAGTLQPLVLAARIASGHTTSTTTGKTYELSNRFGAQNEGDLIWRFLRSKEAPLVGLTADLWTGTDWQGEEKSRVGAVAERFVPMLLTDLYDVYKKNPEYRELIIPAAALGAFGGSVQTYEPKKKKPKRMRMPLGLGGLGLEMSGVSSMPD